MAIITQDFLQGLFPPSKTDQFFDALFGGAEEGAYTIRLSPRQESDEAVDIAMELHQRPGKCLVCSLTYGLPDVFRRHPIINARGIAEAVAKKMGWESHEWAIGPTREEGQSMHWIPFQVTKK